MKGHFNRRLVAVALVTFAGLVPNLARGSHGAEVSARSAPADREGTPVGGIVMCQTRYDRNEIAIGCTTGTAGRACSSSSSCVSQAAPLEPGNSYCVCP